MPGEQIARSTVHPGTLGPIAARDGTLALGGLHPVLLDPKSFALRAPIDALVTEVTALAVHPSRDVLIVGGSGVGVAGVEMSSGGGGYEGP